jgi:hypothetical protein
MSTPPFRPRRPSPHYLPQLVSRHLSAHPRLSFSGRQMLLAMLHTGLLLADCVIRFPYAKVMILTQDQ